MLKCKRVKNVKMPLNNFTDFKQNASNQRINVKGCGITFIYINNTFLICYKFMINMFARYFSIKELRMAKNTFYNFVATTNFEIKMSMQFSFICPWARLLPMMTILSRIMNTSCLHLWSDQMSIKMIFAIIK